MIETFSHAGKEFLKNDGYVMAEDIESQYRSLYKEKIGMSYPFETVYKPYKGEDLSNKRILIFRTGGIGDIFFLNPVLRYLKKKYPNCFIRVASGCKESLENLPEVDELYDMPFNAKLLEDTDFQLMFQGIIEGSSETSKKTHAVDMFFSYFNIDSTHFPNEDKRPRLFFKKEETEWCEKTIADLKIDKSDYVIGIQMETSAPLRNFPKEKMKMVVDTVIKENNVKIMLIGTEAHNIIGHYLRGGNEKIFLATCYNVRESIILATRYDLVISPDTFMVQVAGALEKPLIGIYGPFPSEVRMKYFKNAIGLDPSVVCSPCFKHDFRTCVKGHPSPCFTQIKAEDLLQAIDYMRHKFTGKHFDFMGDLLRVPDLSPIEKYMLSADRGLCFFSGYYKHSNALTVDPNPFFMPDISDMNSEFKREAFPFVVYLGPIGFKPENKPVYDSCKGLIRPGGHFIVHMIDNGTEEFYNEVKRDMGEKAVIMYSNFDPSTKSFSVAARKPY